jgi:hypothetical protein
MRAVAPILLFMAILQSGIPTVQVAETSITNKKKSLAAARDFFLFVIDF